MSILKCISKEKINSRISKILIFFILCFVLFFNLLKTLFGVQYRFLLLIDIANLLLLIINYQKIIKNISKFKIIFILIIIFSLYAIFLQIFIYKNDLILFIYSFRTIFRFYSFLLVCSVVLNESDYRTIFSVLKYVNVLNFIFVLFEYFLLGYRNDNIGGIFGTGVGCNSDLNVFLLISLLYFFISYSFNELSLQCMILSVFMVSIVAVLSEIKIVYIEVLTILLLILFCKIDINRKMKVIVIGMISILLVYFGIQFVYPDWQGKMSLNKLEEQATTISGYTGEYDLNRLNAISEINSRIEDEYNFNELTGMGLGSCEVVENVDLLTSNFYLCHKNWHYNWLGYAIVYLEIGYIGLILYISIYIYIYIYIYKLQSTKR